LRIAVWHASAKRALGVAQACRLGKELRGVLPKRGDGLSKLKELLCRVAHQCHAHVTLPSALAAKAPQDFGQFLVETVNLVRALGGPAGALLCHVCNQRKRFFEPYTGWWHR
jgi:hypothetical protein